MKPGNRKTGARLRIVLEPEVALGPGKADLLEAIGEEGSISAAGRRLSMSYKRAWSLVEEMNRDFGAPLVVAASGGRAGGGASLTEKGQQVLDLYRRMEARASEAIRADMAELRRLRKVGEGT